MTHLDDAALDAIEQRADAATEGPWEEILDAPPDDWMVASVGGGGSYADITGSGLPQPDAEFIAHARTDIPALLAAVREARAADLGWMRDHSRRIEWLIKLLDLDPDDDQGCVPGCTEGPAGLDHMIWHVAEQRDEARAAVRDAQQRAQAVEAALQRVRELAHRYDEHRGDVMGGFIAADIRRALGDDQQEAP